MADNNYHASWFMHFIFLYFKVLGALAVVLCVMGLNMGIIDCLANLKMIHLFGDAVPPFLQVKTSIQRYQILFLLKYQ